MVFAFKRAIITKLDKFLHPTPHPVNIFDWQETRDMPLHLLFTLSNVCRNTKRITITPHCLGGKPRFPGHRVSIRQVGNLILNGHTREKIVRDYDYDWLSEEDIKFAEAFTTMFPGNSY